MPIIFEKGSDLPEEATIVCVALSNQWEPELILFAGCWHGSLMHVQDRLIERCKAAWRPRGVRFFQFPSSHVIADAAPKEANEYTFRTSQGTMMPFYNMALVERWIDDLLIVPDQPLIVETKPC